MGIWEQIGNALSYGGTVAIIGLLIVFLGLAILIGFIYLLAAALKRTSRPQPEKTEAIVEAPAEAPAEIEPVDQAQAEDALSDELIAAIAAAICAFDESGKTLVIRSVRRVGGWKNAARAEQVYKF